MSSLPRELRLREFSTICGVELTLAEVRALKSAGAGLAILVGERGGCYDIEASNIVGTVHLGMLQVVVEPKTPVPALLHMMGYGELPTFGTPARFGKSPELVPYVGELYGELLERALLEGGLVVGYEPQREELRAPRGRIDALHLEMRRFGMFPPVMCDYVELSLDTELNRRLLAAGLLLVRAGATSWKLKRALQGFDAVSPSTYHRQGAVPVVLDRRTERFRPALSLAEAVLRHASLDLSASTVWGASFLVDVSKVFEAFSMRALGARLDSASFRLISSPPGLTLDVDGRVRITPDGLVADRRGPVCVLDAKYKSVSTARNADLYQMAAYCTALGCKLGVLIYADTADEQYVLRESGARLVVAGVDLNRSPSALDARMDELARLVTGVVADASAPARAAVGM